MAKMKKKDERVSSSVLQRQLLSFRASAREEVAHGEKEKSERRDAARGKGFAVKETRNQLRIDEKRVFNGETGARFSTKKRAKEREYHSHVAEFISSSLPHHLLRAKTARKPFAERRLFSLSLSFPF